MLEHVTRATASAAQHYRLSRPVPVQRLSAFGSQSIQHFDLTEAPTRCDAGLRAERPVGMRLGIKSLSFRKPSNQHMDDFAEASSRDGANHFLVGATESFEPPLAVSSSTRVVDGWIEDFDATKIGEGKEAFLTAREAVKSWSHMSLGWVETNRPPVKVGSPVCIAAKMLCFWQRNPLEIVYVNDEEAGPMPWSWRNGRRTRGREKTFAFGQTTLSGHALAGEESFTVRWKPDNSVWYEVYAFSRANTVLAIAAYPVRRFFQRKFRRDSARVVAAAVRESDRVPSIA